MLEHIDYLPFALEKTKPGSDRLSEYFIQLVIELGLDSETRSVPQLEISQLGVDLLEALPDTSMSLGDEIDWVEAIRHMHIEDALIVFLLDEKRAASTV